MNYRDRSLVPDDNEADNKSVLYIYIHFFHDIFFLSSFLLSSAFDVVIGLENIKKGERNYHYDALVFSPSPAPSSFNYNEAGCPRNEAAI